MNESAQDKEQAVDANHNIPIDQTRRFVQSRKLSNDKVEEGERRECEPCESTLCESSSPVAPAPGSR